MAVQVSHLDGILVLLVALSYGWEVLTVAPFVYTLFVGGSADNAMIPLLLRYLAQGLIDPSSVAISVLGIAGLSFLPPLATPLLAWPCGKAILPTVVAACGCELSPLARKAWRGKAKREI
jgi:hypothetical protein